MKKFVPIIMLMVIVFSCVQEEDKIIYYVDGGPTIFRTHHFPIDTLGTYDSTLTLQISSDTTWNSIIVGLNGEVLTNPIIVGNSIIFTKEITTATIEYWLEITSDFGDAFAVCSMPGPFKIFKPPSLWITPGQDCEISWQHAQYAQWYELDINCFDTLYQLMWDTSIICTDTSTIIIPGDRINFYGGISVLIIAGNGASLLPGDEGNVKGNGQGFWTARSKTHRAIKLGYW
ncbi:MAG: hypothetical protein OEV79_09355 [candidate division WOR-3 bacterium]|nr:hypothetical protein [candidate division WOR-3 bacterium]